MTNRLPASVSALTCHQPTVFASSRNNNACAHGLLRLRPMRTYRELFRAPEFTPLFLTSSVQVAATTVTGLALGTLVYAATSSPLLSAMIMFGPSLAQLIGATALLSAADRLPPRGAIAGVALVFALGTAGQAIPGLSVQAIFAVAAGLGTIA